MPKNNICNAAGFENTYIATHIRHLDEANNCNGIASYLNSYSSLIFSCRILGILVSIKSQRITCIAGF